MPLLTFGLVSLLGSGLALALPETAGHQLPDSFAEVEQTIEMMMGGGQHLILTPRWQLGEEVDLFGAGICPDRGCQIFTSFAFGFLVNL